MKTAAFLGYRAMFTMSSQWIVILLVILLNEPSTAWYNYGSKTPYEQGNLQDMQEPSGCHVVHLDMVLRHGSRYPCSQTAKTIVKLVEEVNKLHDGSNPFSYKNLTLPWKLPDEFRRAGNCEQEEAGNKEIFQLAKRFRSKYPTLFHKTKYWNANYKFEASDTPRTSKSAVAFSMGLFDGNGTLDSGNYQPIAIKVSGPQKNDKKLRYYDTCPNYVKEIKEGTGMDQWRDFGVGPEMRKVISNVDERLQLKGKMSLNADIVQKMFWLCAFATMNNLGRDWCSLFDREDLDTLEYFDDVMFYYSSSYGNEVSYKTNCPLVADIIGSLDSFVKSNPGRPFGTFRFTHIGTMVALQSILDMYKPSLPLKADNFAQHLNRTFRLSTTVPMAANLAFVLYRCGKDYKVQVLMNEKPAVLPCCNSTCSLDTFKSCYQHIANDCNFDAMCKVPVPTASTAILHPQQWFTAIVSMWLLTYRQTI